MFLKWCDSLFNPWRNLLLLSSFKNVCVDNAGDVEKINLYLFKRSMDRLLGISFFSLNVETCNRRFTEAVMLALCHLYELI